MSKTKKTWIAGAHVEQYLELPYRIEAETADEAIDIAKRDVMIPVGESFISYEVVSEEQLEFDFNKDIKEYPMEDQDD